MAGLISGSLGKARERLFGTLLHNREDDRGDPDSTAADAAAAKYRLETIDLLLIAEASPASLAFSHPDKRRGKRSSRSRL